MTVRFFDVYDHSSMEKIGQVKSDPHRATHKWTALDKTGRRIKDCESREAAEQEVQKAGGAQPAEPQPRHRCAECKGTDIQCAVWVNPNTREAFDDFGSWNNIDTQWCNYCGEHTIFETLPTFTIVHPGGAK